MRLNFGLAFQNGISGVSFGGNGWKTEMITPSKYMLDDVKEVIKLASKLDVPYAINLGLMTPRNGTGRESIKHEISIDDYIDIVRFNRSLRKN